MLRPRTLADFCQRAADFLPAPNRGKFLGPCYRTPAVFWLQLTRRDLGMTHLDPKSPRQKKNK